MHERSGAELVKFFGALFEGCSGYVSLVTDGGRLTTLPIERINETSLASFNAAYFGPGVRKEAVESSEIIALPAAWATVSTTTDTPHDFVLAYVENSRFPKPTIVVFTGVSVNFFWRFPKAWDTSTIDAREDAQGFLSEWQRSFREWGHTKGLCVLDTAALSSLLRIPQRILFLDRAKQYEPAELRQFLARGRTPEPRKAEPDAGLSNLAHALGYAQRGLAVLPLCWPEDGRCGCGRGHEGKEIGKAPLTPTGWKDATRDPDVVKKWWTQYPRANVGIVLSLSDPPLLVADFDSPEATKAAQELPPTPTVRTARGWHYYFRAPPGEWADSTLETPEGRVDIKVTGYATAPPSKHATGAEYEWALPLDTPLAEAPAWVLKLLRKPSQARVVTLPPDLPEIDVDSLRVSERIKELIRTGKGEGYPSRSEAEFAVITAMVASGYTDAEIAATVLQNPIGEKAREQGRTWLAGEIARARSKLTTPPEKISAAEAHKDFGHAQVLSVLFRNRFRWAVHRKSWYEYIKGVWRPVPEEVVAREASEALRRFYSTKLAEAKDKHTIEDLASRVIETFLAVRIRGALWFLRGWPGFVTFADEWDRDPWLLNVRNGTVDLRTGQLRPHDPADLLTKQCPVDYDPTAKGPVWEQHLSLFLPDPDIRRYVQRQLGKALVGTVLDENLDIWYGTGANGKTTTAKILMKVCGDYALRAAPNLLVRTKHQEHPTQIADLFGARLVFSIEVEEGKQLAEALVKELTGGDRQKGRYLYCDYFEWDPTHSIVLIVNHKPVITGTDTAIWRRIRLIPWTFTIPPEDQRPQAEVLADLEAEGSAILNWLLAGLQDWQRDHHWEAPAVKAATEAYRAEQDKLAGFLADRCQLGPNYSVRVATLYEAYTAWCMETEEAPLGKQKFGDLLRSRGLSQQRVGHDRQRHWVGIRLRRDAEK